ncbi:unnamed protein product, partial [Symbiodinium sp. CCMP2456]
MFVHQAICRCLHSVYTEVRLIVPLPVSPMQVRSMVFLSLLTGMCFIMKVETPLAASGVTPTGVNGWEPPVHSGATSGIPETATKELQDRTVNGSAVPVGERGVQELRPQTTKPTAANNENLTETTHGPKATTRGQKGEATVSAATKDMEDAMTMRGTTGEAISILEEIPRQMVEITEGLGTMTQKGADVPRQMVEMAGLIGAIRRKFPKVEDQWYSKLDEDTSHAWSGKSTEFCVDHGFGKGGQTGPAARASERLQVPSFSAEDSEDLGGSARSYLRQIEAWKRMTMLPANKQALVLYQNLSGKAWIAAEELSLGRLGEDTGVTYLVSWVTARFLDLEITRIGRALSDFFRRLRRRPNQTVREYNTEYDRLYGRLRE